MAGSRLFTVCNSLHTALSTLPRSLLLTNDATNFKKWTFLYLLAYSLIQRAGHDALHCDVSLVVLQCRVTKRPSTAAAI